jgi:laminin alpha 3/5
MIIKYLNKNFNISQVFVRVWDVENPDDEQNATVFLQSNKKPSFETITTNQISALILELEEATYSIGFKNKKQSIYIDYFVLLPSDYFESTVLTEKVEKACEDYRNLESCVQYNYPSLDSFSPIKLYNTENGADGVDLDSIKTFNHSFSKPVYAVKLNLNNVFILLTKILNFY